ncbi:head-tail connector protein [Glacieibacterium megasporae]|uniref:head-tail connector protein n=1 Tax=Glacieibacterium megasporae TaxID=2835787 RepID=UPI001C1DDF56|nr:phage head-tail connector protein [Polymorphobacter megasporae]UAJ08807.1 phage head-tail connector protein [Polymorphobacter megasporae]
MGDILPPVVAPVAIEEAKAFLRVDGSSEDALIAGFIRAASGLAEAFTGQALIVRDVAETALITPTWQRLKTAPCVAITGVDAVGGATTGPAFESDIDLSGNGWIRVIDPRGALRVTVRYRAGLAADWNGIPEPLRLGIVRLVSHFHAHRDAPDAGGPPAAVAALWRPWRRLRLG